YEQFTFDEAAIDADRGYLKEGVSLQVLKYNGSPVSLQLPQYVELAVTSMELGMRGDTAAGGAPKQATLETGLTVRVPLFIKEGEVVRVNTQTGEVAGRALEKWAVDEVSIGSSSDRVSSADPDLPILQQAKDEYSKLK